MSALLKLAERCEKAVGPDRELEIALFREVGPVNEVHCKQWCKMDGRTDLTRDRYIAAWAPNYTLSLDAASTLLPHGALWEVEHKLNMGRKYSQLFQKPKGEPDTDFNAGVGLGEVPAHWEYGRSLVSPALALCAAALKARAASGMSTGTAKTPQAVEGQSPASPVGEAETPEHSSSPQPEGG